MDLEKSFPTTQKVDALVARSMKVDRAAFAVVIRIDRAAILHPVYAQHALVQISLAAEDALPVRLIGIDEIGAVDLKPVA